MKSEPFTFRDGPLSVQASRGAEGKVAVTISYLGLRRTIFVPEDVARRLSVWLAQAES